MPFADDAFSSILLKFPSTNPLYNPGCHHPSDFVLCARTRKKRPTPITELIAGTPFEMAMSGPENVLV